MCNLVVQIEQVEENGKVSTEHARSVDRRDLVVKNMIV